MNQPREVPGSLKAVFVATFLIVLMLVPAFLYWNTYVNASGPYVPGSKNDPFTTIWDGRTAGSTFQFPGYVRSAQATDSGSATGSVTISVASGDFVGVYAYIDSVSGQSGMSAVSDSQGNTFTTLEAVNTSPGLLTAYTTASATGSDVISWTCTPGGCGWNGKIGADDFTGISGIGSSNHHTITIATGALTDNLLLSTTTTNSIIWEVGVVQGNNNPNACSTLSGASSQTTAQTLTCESIGGYSISIGFYKAFSTIASQSLTVNDRQFSTTSPFTGTLSHSLLELKLSPNTIAPCSPGYQCLNAYNSAGGAIVLAPNSTFPGIAISQSTVDLATAVSKELSIAELFGVSGGSGPWVIYLTLNSTLPNLAAYSPMTDSSVNLAIIFFRNSQTVTFYVYMSRTSHQSLLGADGRGLNFGETGCVSQIVFLCGHSTTGGSGLGNWQIGFVSNYTARAEGNANSARSYLCMTNSTGGSCDVGGSADGTSTATISPATTAVSYTLPWLNLQQEYFMGFWRAPESGGVTETIANLNNAGCEACNIVSLYVPSATTTVPGNVQEGGFFGWLGRTLGGAVNTVITTVQNAGTFVQNTALGPIGSVLQGMVSWMVTQIVNFLNWVGSGFGFPNLGTSLLATFSDLATIIVQVLLNFVSWVTSTGTFILNTLTFVVNIFANTTIFGLLAFVAGPVLTLLNIILLMITLFFSFTTPLSYLLLMDWLWGILMVYVIGVSGFLWWTDLNVQIFTFVFKMIWKFTELVWRVMVIIKSFIPTEGGTPADLKDPTPSSGPKGGSGSGGKPETKKPSEGKTVKSPSDPRTPHVPKSGHGFKVPPRGYGQGAKDGDPFAILLMGFMIIVVLYWLSQGAFSPLGSQTVVGCVAWSTNCHVQNGVRVGTIDTTVFFAYLFDQSHGVRIVFSLFVPLVVIMFAYWFMRNVVGEDKERGNDFLNIGGTVGTAERSRTATSRRATMRRFRKENE